MSRCRCIGFRGFNGTMLTEYEDPSTKIKSTLSYPSELGSYCKEWDTSKDPRCVAGSGPSWCQKVDKKQRWCFVDACSCTHAVMPEEATIVPELKTAEGRPVFISRATCQPQNDDIWANKDAVGCLRFQDKIACDAAVLGHQCRWSAADNICMEKKRVDIGCPAKSLAMGLPVPKKKKPTTQAPCHEGLCPVGFAVRLKDDGTPHDCATIECTPMDRHQCCVVAALCSTFGGDEGCGDDKVLIAEPELTYCSGSTCAPSDVIACCESKGPCSNLAQEACPPRHTVNRSAWCQHSECDASVDASSCCIPESPSLAAARVAKILVVIGSIFILIYAIYVLLQPDLYRRWDPELQQLSTWREFNSKLSQRNTAPLEIQLMWQSAEEEKRMSPSGVPMSLKAYLAVDKKNRPRHWLAWPLVSGREPFLMYEGQLLTWTQLYAKLKAKGKSTEEVATVHAQVSPVKELDGELLVRADFIKKMKGVSADAGAEAEGEAAAASGKSDSELDKMWNDAPEERAAERKRIDADGELVSRVEFEKSFFETEEGKGLAGKPSGFAAAEQAWRALKQEYKKEPEYGAPMNWWQFATKYIVEGDKDATEIEALFDDCETVEAPAEGEAAPAAAEAEAAKPEDAAKPDDAAKAEEAAKPEGEKKEDAASSK
eukprot:TRINITY_DN457_c1_g1_i1.p1 TRINITY_DN457_c1_g1~~TRINITY_DN457_c1_g1_i1.p1  ORF type:complete len:657 (+),score=137.02 TRINITY_DN457_c1_g1_i1:2049-4019(+)